MDRHPSAEAGMTTNEWFGLMEAKLTKMREGKVIPQLEIHIDGPACKDAVDFMSRVLLDGRYVRPGAKGPAEIAEELELIVSEEIMSEIVASDWNDLTKQALKRMTDLYVESQSQAAVTGGDVVVPHADVGFTIASVTVAIGGAVVIGVGVTIYHIVTTKHNDTFTAIDNSPGAENKL